MLASGWRGNRRARRFGVKSELVVVSQWRGGLVKGMGCVREGYKL